jgi:hypothetical protein
LILVARYAIIYIVGIRLVEGNVKVNVKVTVVTCGACISKDTSVTLNNSLAVLHVLSWGDKYQFGGVGVRRGTFENPEADTIIWGGDW